MRILSRLAATMLTAASLAIAPAAPAAAAEAAVGWMVDVGGTGFEAAVDTPRGLVYVSVPSRREIVAVSLDDHAVVQRFETGRVYGIDLSVDGQTLFGAVDGPGEVMALDLQDGSITRYDIAAKLDDGPTWDVIQPVPGEVWASGNPYSYGFAYIVRIDLETGEQTRVASNRIIRAGPVMETDGQWVYIGEGFSPESLYRVSVATGALVAEDDHGGVSGTHHLALSPEPGGATHVVTASGQEMRADTIRQTGSYGSGIPQYSSDGSQVFVARRPPPNNDWYSTAMIPVVVSRYARGSGQVLEQVTTSCRLTSAPRDFAQTAQGGFLIVGDSSLCITQPPGPGVVCAGRAATVIGTLGNDVLRGTADADVIAGLDGNDLIDGLGANDVLCGNDGRDTLVGGLGNDTLAGGGGTDVGWYAQSAAAVNADLESGVASGQGTDTLTEIEDLMGSPFADTLTGGDGANTITGRDGNDMLGGGPGADTMVGGAGTDTVTFAAAAAGVTANLAAGTATGEGADALRTIENIIGSSHHDDLRGDGHVNVLHGEGGPDTLEGGGEDDVLAGGGGADDLIGGGGRDTASFTSSGGPVVVDLQAGTASGEGDDTLAGIAAAVGGPFDDRLFGDAARNILSGGGGVDVIYGRFGPDTLNGDGGNDRLYGETGDDYLRGGPGYDELRGGAGYDVLDGGTEPDTCLSGERLRLCESTTTPKRL